MLIRFHSDPPCYKIKEPAQSDILASYRHWLWLNGSGSGAKLRCCFCWSFHLHLISAFFAFKIDPLSVGGYLAQFLPAYGTVKPYMCIIHKDPLFCVYLWTLLPLLLVFLHLLCSK